MARRLLHAAAFTGLCGAVGYFATDALETALLYRTSSRYQRATCCSDLQMHMRADAAVLQAWHGPFLIAVHTHVAVFVREGHMCFNTDRLLLEHVDQDADLREQLGPPVRIGKWYNAMVSVRSGGAAADCSMSLSGAQRDANATIQVCWRAYADLDAIAHMVRRQHSVPRIRHRVGMTIWVVGRCFCRSWCTASTALMVVQDSSISAEFTAGMLSNQGCCCCPQISRKPSPHHSVLLYQLLGPADWDVVAVNAMVSKGESELHWWLPIEDLVESVNAHCLGVMTRQRLLQDGLLQHVYGVDAAGAPKYRSPNAV